MIMRVNKFFLSFLLFVSVMLSISLMTCADEISVYEKTFADVNFYASEKKINEIKFAEVMSTQPCVRAKLYNMSVSGDIRSIKYAVWSAENGQDDIVWYDAKKSSDYYYSDFNLSVHASMGKYIVHCYAQLTNGKMQFLSASEFNVEVPEASDVKISNLNTNSGNFTIVVSGVKNRIGLGILYLKVSTSSNSYWYIAERTGVDTYQVKADIKNNDFQSGKYSVSVVLQDLSKKQYRGPEAECLIEKKYDAINISDKNNNECEYDIEVKNPVVPGGFEDIRVAVWSKKNGQDDIVWYNTKSNGSTYSCTVPVSKHKTAGEYCVHVYARNKYNKMIFLGSESFEVKASVSASMIMSSIDRNTGQMQIRIYDIKAKSGVTSVEVPTWSKSDQSDIKWYKAEKQSDGSYLVNFDIRNHKNNWGKYNCHVYVTLNNGIKSLACSKKYNLTKQSLDDYLYTTDINTSIKCEELKNKAGFYKISVTKPDTDIDYESIQFSVWNAAKSSNKSLWFDTTLSDSVYSADVSMMSFDDYGKYKVVAWMLTKDGERVMFSSSSFEIKKPSLGSVEVSDVNLGNGTFRVRMTDIKNTSSVKKIMVSVRPENSPAKIYWYDAKKEAGTDNYSVDVNVANHGYCSDTYVVDAYIVDLRNEKLYMKYIKQDMKFCIERFYTGNDQGKEFYEGVFMYNLKYPGGVKNVKFAVWSKANGQDDLVWYDAVVSDKFYYYYVPVSNHKTLGEYNVHAYAVKKNGEMTFLGASSFEVTNKPSAKLKISDVNSNKGTFKITVYDINAASGVSKVQIPVWSAANQSDIKWYEATRMSDGSYVATVNVANHKYNFGTYNVHAYITMGNGIRSIVYSTKQSISPVNYIKTEKLDAYTMRVTILNAGNGKADSVQFPTWSSANGQDDIVWYNGTYAGNGNWVAVINSGNHKDYGEFTTHVYVNYRGDKTNAGAVKYSLLGRDYSMLIGSFSTVSQNNTNGTFNMTKALLSFNGVVLRPGETLSFFAQAGPCGLAQGYKEAGTVQGSGYGGGICQASTTLYGAALRAGMTIVERRSHSARSVYVPIGQDAMVSYGSSDFKFRNDLEHPVKIVTYVIGKTLYAEFWGLQPSWYDDVQINSWATGAKTAAAERVFLKNGVVVKRERLTNSYYPNS